MKVQEVLTKTTQFFKEKNIDTARLDAELLIAKALGLRRIDLYLRFEQPLKEEEVVTCREYLRRRVSGEPVAYILNEKGFFGLDFYVDSRVLIPRPESEQLVEIALDELQRLRPREKKQNRSAVVETPLDETPVDETTASKAASTFSILDLGSGSGCLGIAILAQRPDTQVTFVDRSSEALEVAKKNAEANQVLSRCQFTHARVQDLDFPFDSVDLIVTNPPYIRKGAPELSPQVEKFEPHLALFGGDSGLEEIEQWLPKCFQWLKSGGLLAMEIGADQGPRVLAEFEKNNFVGCDIRKDLAGLDRVVVGKKGF